jgi:hypothetical protein
MKKFICLAVLVLSLYVCGSSKPDNAIKTNTPAKTKTEIIQKINKADYATKAWVYETFSLTDKNFKGINLNAVLESYPIEKKTLMAYNPGKVVSFLTETHKAVYATKEWVYETFSLTDKDFEGVDLDIVFETYDIEKTTLLEYKPDKVVHVLIRSYKKALEEKEAMKYNKTYLVKAENREVCPSFDNIKFLAFSVAMGDGNGSYLIDFENKVMYSKFGYPVVYEDYREAKSKITLSKDDISAIKQLLKSNGVANWNYYYDGSAEVYEGFGWKLGMEFSDGTVISKSGDGEADSVFPDNLGKFDDSIDVIRRKYVK